MDTIQHIGLIMGVGWAAGLNLYAAIAILSGFHLAGWMVLPPGLVVLADERILVLSLILYAIEFGVDKIPVVDSGWDVIHSFIRPFGAATIAYLGSQGAGPTSELVFAMLSGSCAFSSHATKATLRVAINTSPEPVSNWTASIAEDIAAVFGLWFAFNHPVLMLVFVVLFCIFSVWFLSKFYKFFKRLFKKPKAA